MSAAKEANVGSLEHPFKRTPREVGSIRKWRTRSSGVGGGRESAAREAATEAGSSETRKARPKAPGKELESLTTNVPGDLSLRRLIASSLDIEGLYQNWDESRTNTGCDFRTSPPSCEVRLDLLEPK